MKHFIRLTDYTAQELSDMFHIADGIREGKYQDLLKGKSAVLSEGL